MDKYPQAPLYGALYDEEGTHKGAPQRSWGSTFWSPVRVTRDSQGVLPSGRIGMVPDGCHRGALHLHVFVEGWSIEEAPGITTSTDKL